MDNFSSCEVRFYDRNEMMGIKNLSFAKMDSYIRQATTLEQRIKYVTYNEDTGETVIENKEIAIKLWQRFIDEGYFYPHFDTLKYFTTKVTLMRK